MTDVEASFEDFNASRRTGRRNAIYEIPQGLGGPGPAESDAVASLLSGNKPGEDGELVNKCHLLVGCDKDGSVIKNWFKKKKKKCFRVSF